MGITVKRFIFKYYVPILLFVFLVAVVWFVFFSPKGRDEIGLFLTVFGGLASFFYFIQKQQLEELGAFKELFKDFNGRYDKLNEVLNKIVEEDENTPLTEDQLNTLNDYFNLCGEEYLFYKKGYIYAEVWRAWCNGMKFFLDCKRIGDKWAEEEKSDSYYGLTLSEIKKQTR